MHSLFPVGRRKTFLLLNALVLVVMVVMLQKFTSSWLRKKKFSCWIRKVFCKNLILDLWLFLHAFASGGEEGMIEESRKVKALRVLALRVAAYLRWDLSVLEKR